MTFGLATYALGAAAGALSTLSPCVLPLVPVLVASAAAAHRCGPLALGAGLALSYMVMGMAIAPLGAALGLDPDTLRIAGAVLIVLFGVVLLVPALQAGLAKITAGASNTGQQLLGRVSGDGLAAQWLVGLVLGVVWSPCVGPTLGAATTLASRGENLGEVAMLMLLFGVGAAVPLVALGMLSRATLLRIRGRLHSAGAIGKQILGTVLVAFGLLIATGLNRTLETWLLDRSPAWLTALTTHF